MDSATLQKIKQLRPIDDALFEVLIKDKNVCQEILRTILENPDLMVLSVDPQYSYKNLAGRSVRLDARCKIGNKHFCNIEVQRADKDHHEHARRVRYNASIMTIGETPAGSKFADIPDVTIVYISEFDPFGRGKTTYRCRTVDIDDGTPIADGLYEIFVNTAVDDGSAIAELMKCFKSPNIDSKMFPMLSKQAGYFKNDERGQKAMSSVMDEYYQERMAEDIKANVKKAFQKNVSFDVAVSIFEQLPKETIAQIYEEVHGVNPLA